MRCEDTGVYANRLLLEWGWLVGYGCKRVEGVEVKRDPAWREWLVALGC